MSFLFFSFLLPYNILLFVIMALLISFLITWVRITFCRFRYDMLMMTSWKVLLPFSLLVFILCVFVMM